MLFASKIDPGLCPNQPSHGPKLNGKDDNLRRADFRKLAATTRLAVTVPDAVIDGSLGKLQTALATVASRMVLPGESGR
jgi:hypothetical protein